MWGGRVEGWEVSGGSVIMVAMQSELAGCIDSYVHCT